MATKHVILGGGTGFIGRYIKEALLKRGCKVTIISRTAGPDQMTWNTLERLGLPNDTMAVINVAGRNILDPVQGWTDKFKKVVRDSRIETTKSLTKAILTSKVKSYITISGISYYPPNGGTEYTEDNICEKYDFFSELTHDWEAAAKLPNHSKCRQIIIRSGVVLGKHGGMIQQILMPYLLCLGGSMGSGNQLIPWIHVKDLARLFVHAIHDNKVVGVLNGVAPQIITNKQFAKSFAAALNRPAALSIPEFMLKIIFAERAKLILEGQRVIPKRVLLSGFVYEYTDIDKACKGIVADIDDKNV